MKKQNLKLAAGLFFAGFAAGVTIGVTVNIIVSLCIGGGEYLPAMPKLLAAFKTETGAVIAGNLLCGMIGVVFAESSFIFTLERIGFLYRCLLHFAVTAVFYVPFVLLCYGVKNVLNTVMILLNIIFTYALTWFLRFMQDRRAVRLLNSRIEEVRRNERN